MEENIGGLRSSHYDVGLVIIYAAFQLRRGGVGRGGLWSPCSTTIITDPTHLNIHA